MSARRPLAHRVTADPRMAIITIALAPVLLLAALLTIAIAGLSNLMDPAEEFELAEPGDLWLDRPLPAKPAAEQGR